MRVRYFILLFILVFLLAPMRAFASPDYWTNDFRLSTDGGQSLYPAIACDHSGTTIYAVWLDDRSGSWDVFFKRSFDFGKTWSASVNITNNAADAAYPNITWYTPNRLLLTWLDYRGGSGDIYMMQSQDDGTTWTDLQGNVGQVTNVSNRGNPAASFSRPRATMNAWGTHVVWADNTSGNALIYYLNVTVAATVSIKPDSIGATLPAIATRNYSWSPSTELFLVWEEGSGANSSIYFTHSQDGGVTWLDNNNMPGHDDISHKWGSSTARHPDLYVSGDTAAGVDVAFLDDRQSTDQVYWQAGRLDSAPPITWDDGGGMTGAPNTMTSMAVAPQWLSVPQLAGSEHIMVWQDNRDSNYEIYVCQGMGGGHIMFNPPERLTLDAADSIFPAIAGNDAFTAMRHDFYLLWCDNRDTNYEIYFKRTDTIAADSIQDLAAVTGSNPGEVDLTWLAPDDNACPKVQLYMIGHDTDEIGSYFEFLNEATQVPQTLDPKNPGQAESFTVIGLTPGSSYYFAILSVDQAGNTSAVSNSPQAAACDIFTVTSTYTHSGTVTNTSTFTPTVTITTTSTITGTQTPTPTNTETLTQSATLTPSGTYTVTPSATPTATISATLTVSGTYTDTPTHTRSATPTLTRTVSATSTQSTTYTTTPTISVTTTALPTRSITRTVPPTMTQTQTPAISRADFIAYPNPAREKITFAYYLEKPGTAYLEIYNMPGEQVAAVQEVKLEYQHMAITQWETNTIAAGVYLVRFTVRYSDGTLKKAELYKIAIVK